MSGYQTRDFIYVKDIVKSLILSMNKLHKSDICETFNVGTGTSVSVDNLLEILINLTKKNPKLSEPNYLWATQKFQLALIQNYKV